MSNERIEAIRKEVEEYEEVMKMELGCHYINPSMPRMRDLLDHIDKLESAAEGVLDYLSCMEDNQGYGRYYIKAEEIVNMREALNK